MNSFMNLMMADNYEERKVGRWDSDDGKRIVSTVRVYDSAYPYETAVQHEDYNDGDMVIVAMYTSKEEAKRGHERWLKLTQGDQLPNPLKDVSSATVAMLCDAFDDEEVSWRIYYRMTPPT